MRAQGGEAVLIVEPRALLADCLAAGLRGLGVRVVEARPCHDAGEPAPHQDAPRPRVAVVALHRDDHTRACAAITSLTDDGTWVIAVIDELDLDVTEQAFDAGAVEVLTIDRPLPELVEHLARATGRGRTSTTGHRGQVIALPRDDEPVAPDPLHRFSLLSTSEEAVLRDLMRGHTPEEISRDRFVALSTVRSQIRSILSKLGVNSQLAAVALAFRSGWQELRKLA